MNTKLENETKNTYKLHYFADFSPPNCTILQILSIQTALFCKFWTRKLHYFTDFGLPNCTILQFESLKSAK